MSDLYIELNENRKSHTIIIGSEDRFTHFLSQAAMCSLLLCIWCVCLACKCSTLSVLLAKLTGVYRAEDQGGADESEGASRSLRLAVVLLRHHRWLRELQTRVLLMMLIYSQLMPPTFMLISYI